MLFKNPHWQPKTFLVNHWQINYLCFEKDHTKGKSPVVILGGAFQRFESFRRDVEILQESFPVILVDLPGQGGNEQLGTGLGFEEYAHLLKDFMDGIGLKKISPISLSYGSAIGFYFACFYPERTERLILAGTTPSLRDSARQLLEESLLLLEQGLDEEFAQGVVLNLMNYPRRKEIRGAEILGRGLYRSMRNLTILEKEKYRQNTRRLLDAPELPLEGPKVETLVMAGEWDHFTTPYECFQVAKKFSRSVFGIVAAADHLAPYLKKDLVNETFIHFLNGERLSSREGLIIYRQDSYPAALRQMEPRYAYHEKAFLDAGNGMRALVEIEDLNMFGCRLRLSELARELLRAKEVKLCLTDGKISLGLLFFKEDSLTACALFKRTQFKQMLEMETHLASLFPMGLCRAA